MVEISGDVIIGQDGWLFLAGGSNEVLRYYTEPGFFSDEAKAKWAGVLTDRAERCGQTGIQYLHMTAPDKITVYNDRVGSNIIHGVLPPSRAMSEYLLGHPLAQGAWIDLAGAFDEARYTSDLYWKTDTHWSFNGASAAYRELCRVLGATVNDGIFSRESFYLDIPLDLGGKLAPPVIETFEVKRVLQDAHRSAANELVRGKEERQKENDAGLHVGSDVTFTNNWSGKDPRRVMIFGDSFCEYRPHLLTGLIAETFAETRFVWSTRVDWEEVEVFKPDVLITEIAERFMNQVPNDAGFSLKALVAEKMQRLEALSAA